MNFPSQFFPPTVAWPCMAIALCALGYSLLKAPWRKLNRDALLHVWLGMSVGLMLLWSIRTGIKPGLNFHLLGATTLTLMFGPYLALTALAVVLVGVTLAGHAGWEGFGANLLAMGVIPVLFSHALYLLADRKLPNHLFIYIFVAAFAGAGCAMLLSGASATLLLAFSNMYTGHYLASNYLPYFILMAWSEAMLTGMAITLMTAFRPAWLATFDDLRYLGRQGRHGNQ